MNIGLLCEQEKDFQRYLEFIRTRSYLSDTELLTNLSAVYKKIYMITSLASSIVKISPRSDIGNFYYECKNNLILSFDLCNTNYSNASKQILRSGIESFFRLSLALQHYIEYRDNKSKGIFYATPLLKKLKSMQQIHSVGRVTNFVVNFYKDEPVGDIFKELNDKYSQLSGSVHVNKKENFTPQKYLSDYAHIDINKSSDYLNIFENIINSIIIILYYFSFLLIKEEVYFSRKDITEFSQTLVTTTHLEGIESKLEQLNDTSSSNLI
ncbi:hypothetical protein [Paenibacillus dendritiformis]|uniref:hypothetical protein n=1 Tax=Paenibacillus dendritiformis TaxID=130049 RepID=UPI00387E12A7